MERYVFESGDLYDLLVEAVELDGRSDFTEPFAIVVQFDDGDTVIDVMDMDEWEMEQKASYPVDAWRVESDEDLYVIARCIEAPDVRFY